MLSRIKKTIEGKVAAHASSTPRESVLKTLASSGALRLDPSTGAVLALARDAGTLISASTDGGLRAWDTSSGELLSQTKALDERTRELTSMVVARASSGSAACCASSDGGVLMRDLRSGRVVKTLRGCSSAILSLCAMPLSGEVVAGDVRGGIYVWDVDGGEYPTWRFGVAAREFVGDGADAKAPGKGRVGRSGVIAPDGVRALCGWVHRSTQSEFVASGAEDGALTIWKTRVGRPLGTFGVLEGGHRGAILSVCDNDGVIVTAGADGRVLAWYLNEHGELLGPPEELNIGGKHIGAVLNVLSISPGVVCSAGSDQRALIFDVRSRSLMFECPSTKAGVVHSLVIDADAGVLYTGTASSQILRWQIPAGEVMSPRGKDDGLLLARNFSAEDLMESKEEKFDGFEKPTEEPEAHDLEEHEPQEEVESAATLVEAQFKKEASLLRLSLKDARDECLRLKQADQKRTNYVRDLENELETVKRELVISRADSSPAQSSDEELTELRSKCEKMEAIARKQKAKLDELRGELGELKNMHSATLQEKDAKCAELSAELDRARESLEEAENQKTVKADMTLADMMAAAEKALESPLPSQETSQETMRELHAAREELQIAQQHASVAEKTIFQLRAECEKLNSQLASSTHDMYGLSSKIEDLTNAANLITQERDDLWRRLDASSRGRDHELETLKSELAFAVEKVDKVQALKNENDAELENLRVEIQQGRRKLETAVKKGKGFQEESAQLRRQLQDKAAELPAVVDASQQIDSETELKARMEEFLALKRELEVLRSQMEDEQARSETRHEESIALRRQLDEADESTHKMHATLKARQEEIDTLTVRLSSTTESSSAELRSLAVAVSAKDAEIQQLYARLTELERMRTELLPVIDATTAQVAALEKALHAKDAENMQLSERVAQSKQKFDNAVSRGKGFQEQAAQLKLDLSANEAKLSQLSSLNEQLEARLKDAQRASTNSDEESKKLSVNVERLEARARALELELAEQAALRVRLASESEAAISHLEARLKDVQNANEAHILELTSSNKQLEARLMDVQSASTIRIEDSKILTANLRSAESRIRELEMDLAESSAQASDELSALALKLDAANTELDRRRADAVVHEEEIQRLTSQLSSFNDAQREMASLRESLHEYEHDMAALLGTVDTAKMKFTHALKKGRMFQEEAKSLREQLVSKESELTQSLSIKASSDERIVELVKSLESAEAKLRDGAAKVQTKTEEVLQLTAQLQRSEARCAELEAHVERTDRRARDETTRTVDTRGQHWLEQQARTAADERTRYLTEENERLRDEVAAATAAAAEAWQVVAAHGVDRPGDSRPVSEMGSPIRDSYGARARSLYQQPTFRGAMSMIHERVDPVVPKSEYDKLKDLCVRLKRDLASSKQAAKEAVQQVINRLEIEVMAKVHAEAAAKFAQAECERAWSHAKDAIAKIGTVHKNMSTATASMTKPLSFAVAEALKPQPPPGTRAASAQELKLNQPEALFVMRQEHLPSIIFAFLSLLVGMLLAKT